MSKKSQVSMQPYRGTKDYFPEDLRYVSHVNDIWRTTAKSFCYEEYAGPFLEPIELYLSKTSEEIVNEQLYHVYDKGERHLAIRPEMTPTLARMVASRAKQLIKPIRWFSIATCMRYERPQKSRLRQFDQFNLDVLGGDPHDEDVEVLLTIVQMLRNLGASGKDYRIKINHRGVVNGFLNGLNMPADNHVKALRLMDHRDKISHDDFVAGLAELEIEKEDIEKISQFMEGDLSTAMSLVGPSDSHVSYLGSLIDELKLACPAEKEVFTFAPDVMRGFDYYTGIVFEVFDHHPENRRALFGGGRYDNLVGSFGVDPISGVGYGVSEISLINFMKAHALLPDNSREVDVFLFSLFPDAKGAVSALAMHLRSVGLRVEQSMGARKLAKLFSHADRIGAKSAAFIGESELEKGEFSVKWLESKEQETYSLDGIESFIAKI